MKKNFIAKKKSISDYIEKTTPKLFIPFAASATAAHPEDKEIKSILKDFPLPSIYLHYNSTSNRYEIVYGKQRLTSILLFIDP